ncbi:hypothetical protein [Jannaschia donghaensis]|uniref:NAD-dependent DNA ligase LigA n=1 Tax=Jannaschia donghaensis TaxID=420998 RepID=A0A0M6YEV8_9RHOB|nr:hypothetical protein [Jannaschia donghaensis]CTQ48299.1 NAD-dependent DNA ligase LigA [Jannaschia donghaensis]
MAKIGYESEVLDSIHAKANTAKNECFFVGFLDGVLANARIDETELEPLLAECASICRLAGDADAAEIIAEASAGHVDTPAELLELLTQIAEIRADKIDATCHRSSANRILGICAGINCDAIITTAEARKLAVVLSSDHDLSHDPRISALRHAVRDSLEDDKITPEEGEEISHLITQLVGDSYAETGIPSSEAVPVINDLDAIDDATLEGRKVLLTGAFAFGTRRAVSDRLQEFGAIIQTSASAKTEIVIIGSEGSPNWTHMSHGGKLSKVLALRAEAPAPRIYVEAQLSAVLADRPD